jgi:mannose-1-phosphate guanylyltransferase
MARWGLILAGGRGTRFWPRSRAARAKQVLTFFGDRTLIQQTVDRLKPVIPPERLLILTSKELREEIVRQLPEVPRSQVIAEPVGRNTAPAIGLAARILEDCDPGASMGVFPADHIITKPKRYLQFVRAAFQAAEAGKLAVLGIAPRWAETGYGYIEFPRGTPAGSPTPVAVKSFREKPDEKTAKQFVRAGRFFWNAGMFFWKASVYREALRTHLPETAALIDLLPKLTARAFGAALAESFPKCENISVDYAVMEKAANVVGLATDDFGWNDVGSWNAVYELSPRDADGNAGRGEWLAFASRGNYIDSPSKPVALVGVDDLVVVDTPDALLITRRDKAQLVGAVPKELERRGRRQLT